ncbi:MAG: UbiD family decarboxylase, partial [Alphaproteobacteria bacterium]|nr:UbiD family decarboxylase [Alphaproteobacteria bacterium]
MPSDMSVSAGSLTENSKSVSPGTAEPRRGANSSDLDSWLEKAEAMGELKRITAEVDCRMEASTLTYLVGSQKSPALLFENVKDHPGHKLLYNMIGCNLSRFCLMIGEEPAEHPLDAVRALQRKMGKKMAPREVPASSAISNQNIWNGDEIDIRKFPA